MSNMEIYELARQCPANALKPIQAGRLKGKSDINPMWRIKRLTELFGACGFGWYYEIARQWLETGANGETAAFVNINLYVKQGDEWSKPIPGTGGSAFIAKEKNGLFTSDECFKMALTDAISVACKALGFAADVYWESDSTKYSSAGNAPRQSRQTVTDGQLNRIRELSQAAGVPIDKIRAGYRLNDIRDMTSELAVRVIAELEKRAKESKNAE